MSGQPYNTRLDMAKARQAYLANLQLRAELDDKNLQANKVYIKTGQLPVEPTDTRTLTEKLADVERLKIDIRSKLQEITDGEQAGKIVENLSPDQLTFLSQNFQPIKEQMKRNYALGVPADAFVDYLRRYIEKFNLTKGVELGLQQSSARELLANQEIILNRMVGVNDLDRITYYVREAGIQNSQLGRNLKDNIDELKYAMGILSADVLNQQKFNSIENAVERAEILQLLTNITETMPDKVEIRTLLLELEKASVRRDVGTLVQILSKLQELTDTGTDLREEIGVLQKIIDENRPIDTIPVENIPYAGPATSYEQGFPEPTSALGRQLVSNNGYKTIDRDKAGIPFLGTIGAKKEYIQSLFRGNYLLGNMNDTIKEITKEIPVISRENPNGVTLSQLKNDDWCNYVIKELNKRLRDMMYQGSIPDDQLVAHYGRGMKGKGIARARPSQVLQSDIDYTKGIQPSAKFVPIGRYLINKRQLDKDIIAIKRPAGSTIPTLPSQRVSRNFGNVMRKVVGGGLPTYEELSNLTDDERVYLHKVAKETRIDDKLSIPTPKKDEDERDINQFEILKGEILSGNDNIELVKKFKTIIMKLSRKDLIPKAQVKDLLLDLATLGH